MLNNNIILIVIIIEYIGISINRYSRDFILCKNKTDFIITQNVKSSMNL